MKIYNKKTTSWQIPLFLGLIFILVGFWFKFLDFASSIQIAIFAALLWYSFETRDLKISSELNNELEQKPIVDLFFRTKTDSHEEYFRLRNSGKGVAYNIKVEPINIDEKTFNFYFNDPNAILAPLKDEQTIHIDARNGKGHLGSRQLDFFKNTVSPQKVFSKDDLKEVIFLISYENAVKQKFCRIFRFYCTTPATNDFLIEFLEEKGEL